MIEAGIFLAGIAIGSIITSKVATARTAKMLHKRGEALREITNHKWDTGDHNDAVVITRIALDGLEHDHRRMGK